MSRSFLQTPFWVKFKEQNGWKAYKVEDIWILGKNLFGNKSFLYAPEVAWSQVISHSERSEESPTNVGSETSSEILRLTPQNDNILQDILEQIKEISQKTQAIFIRLEILDKIDQNIIDKLKENGFIKAFEEIQPEWRQVIDISKSEEEILAGMKQKGRYNIKIAEKHNVSIEKSQKIDDFYEIFRQTAKRDGFKIRPLKYFQDLIQILGQEGVAELWQARYNNKTIVAIIAVFYDGVASYLYGASSDEFRNVMAPYLLHWKVIQRAKEKNCQSYDLLAVEPQSHSERSEESPTNVGFETSSEILRLTPQNDNNHHKYTGITRFKEQFGGEKVQIVGSYDYVYKPTYYRLFKMAEKCRRK